MASLALLIAITLILSFGFLGGYAGMFTSYYHGFFDALRICTNDSSTSQGQCVLDMSHSPLSPRREYTHIPTIDSMINVLLEFFAQGLKRQPNAGHIDFETLLAFTYMASQFGGAWFLMVLEGLRRVNAGTVLSWTGTFGLAFQAATITIIAPIYLCLQLVASRVPSPPRSLLIDLIDLKFLPLSTTIAFILPSIAIGLPLLGVLSPEANYLCIALWQPFPAYQTAIHSFLCYFWGSKKTPVDNTAHFAAASYQTALDNAYRFILRFTVGAHFIVGGSIFVFNLSNFLPHVSPTKIFGLTSLKNAPTLAVLDPPVSAFASTEIVVSFLRWDVYCASASFVIWAIYHLRLVKKSNNLIVLFAKVGLWLGLGGPIAPAVAMMWERDVESLKRWEQLKEEEKSQDSRT